LGSVNNSKKNGNPDLDMEVAAEDVIDFKAAFRGNFTGILQWQQLDQLWQTVKQSEDDEWYIYAIGESVPEQPVTLLELVKFINEIDVLLRREHDEDYCGIVYADSKQCPAFIKIFDPNNLGVVCGFSDNPPLPGWILSTVKPEPLEDMRPLPGNRKRWWKRIWTS
jgi:hypothetical protein